jgi:ribose-phosphate pyrophosphokinase
LAPHEKRKLMLFAGNSSAELGKEIADYLGIQLGQVKISEFANGELYVKYLESVRGADIFLVQTMCSPVNNHLMELLIMIDALKRASAERISAVIPFYGYARQDKKTSGREPITAKLVADLLTIAGADRVLSMDLHAGQIQGFFNMPVDHLTALPVLTDYFLEKKIEDLVVVSPDVGRVKMAKKYADKLDAGLAILHKTRPAHNVAEIGHVVGEVEGCTALLVDDMIDTAGTITEGAKTVVKAGAKQVLACATHGVLSGPAIERIKSSPIEELVLTNTLPLPPMDELPMLKVLSIAQIFAQTILNVYEDESVSAIFEEDNFM